MNEWSDEIYVTPITPEHLADTYRKFCEFKCTSDAIYFRGGIFETSDSRLEFMIDNNIKTIDELLERYPR
jgi:hypothetical protein